LTLTSQSGSAAEPRQKPSGTHRAFEASLDFFLAPIVSLMRDPEVSEILINGPHKVYVERGGKLSLTPIRFSSEHDLRAAAYNISQYAGQTIGDDRPLMDGRLPDGSRVCVVLAPIAAGGTSVNIRRFARSAVTPEFLLQRQAITPLALQFLLLAVGAHVNLLISGGTGSGKTTFLNVLSTGFSEDERIVVIEDTRELQIQREHVVQMEARPPNAYGRGQITIRDLFVSSLRMRPDRIVVGEVRRGEALDMIQAMTSGHRGSLATLHASTPRDACHRLETMALLADVGIPLAALRRQVASAIDLIVQTARLPSGRRLVTHISEPAFNESTNSYKIRDLFYLQQAQHGQELTWTGQPARISQEIRLSGLAIPPGLTEIVTDGEPKEAA
jgi:pilus assembly protein CpaF